MIRRQYKRTVVYFSMATGLFCGAGNTGSLAQISGSLQRAKDPGPRPNPATGIPNPVQGLNANEMALFTESLLRVSELEGTCDTCSQQTQGVPPIDPDPKNPF